MFESHSVHPYPEARYAPTDKKRAIFARQVPRQNHLLAALPPEDYDRLRPDLEPVRLPLGWIIHRGGDN